MFSVAVAENMSRTAMMRRENAHLRFRGIFLFGDQPPLKRGAS